MTILNIKNAQGINMKMRSRMKKFMIEDIFTNVSEGHGIIQYFKCKNLLRN